MKDRPRYFIGAVTLAIGAVGVLLATMSTNAASLAASSVTWTDNFSNISLDSRWSWVREAPTHWSLIARPGFLRITTQRGTLWGLSNNAKNLLVQDAPVGDFEIRTRVILTPTENYQAAGLLIYQDDDNWLRLARDYCDSPGCVGNGIYFDIEEGLNPSNYVITTTVQGEAYLQVVRQGNAYTANFSPDGNGWTLVGSHVVSGLVPLRVGLAAMNSETNAAEVPADFDFFTLIDNSQRLYLPLILK